MKISANSPCSCHSGKKYKKCCKPYHSNAQIPATAELLMRSRYAAYALNLSEYIMKTTHPSHPDTQKVTWKEDLESFSLSTKFVSLKILGKSQENGVCYVTFKAGLLSHDKEDVSFIEKSRFLKEGNSWLYESGEHL